MDTYEICKNGADNKEILKVIFKKCFDSSSLSVFKKNIEYINSQYLETNDLVKSNILYENNDYLLISRIERNNKLELMNGEELKEYFEENGSYLLLKTLIKVLRIFHKNNLYHGGIKLSNIMIKEKDINNSINATDKYEICDYFYLFLNDNKLNISNRNVNYLSPEEIMCKKCNIKKDMWNIGLLLYKTISGKFPFEGKSIMKTMSNIFNVEYDDLNVDFSELLNSLIHKLLIKESEKRISIEEFEVEIDKINNINYIDVVIPSVEGLIEAKTLKEEKVDTLIQDKKTVDDEEKEVKFVYEYKHEYISISEDGKTITNTGGSGYFSHCYLNIEITKDVHHFLFKIKHGKDFIVLGCSSNKEYEGDGLYFDETACSIKLCNNASILYGLNGYEMKKDKFEEIFRKEGEYYELIFNMKDYTISLIQGDGKKELLWSILKTPVYPFVGIFSKDDSVSLIRYWKEDNTTNTTEKKGLLGWLLPF